MIGPNLKAGLKFLDNCSVTQKACSSFNPEVSDLKMTDSNNLNESSEEEEKNLSEEIEQHSEDESNADEISENLDEF